MGSANRVNASGCEGQECGNRCSFGERRSIIEEIMMGVTADTEHSHQQSGSKEKERVQYLINKQIIQNKTIRWG
jgi:hypothetical protein